MTQNPKRSIISLDRITIRVRDRWMLHDTSWEIRMGEHWVVLGPNGAGKSSLVRVLTNETPVVRGRVIRHLPNLSREHVGYVSFELHENLLSRENRLDESRYFSGRFDDILTVGKFLETASGVKSGPERMLWETSLPSIGHLTDRPIRDLSIGEMRKVLIGRALAKSPVLLILDEPFEGLDAASMAELSETIQKMADANRRLSIILVTHRLEKIPACFSRFLALKSGRVVFGGKLGEMSATDLAKRLYDRPEPGSLPALPDTKTNNRSDFNSPNLIEMEDVTVRYGKTTVLKNLNWTMRQGEHWAVAGPNGSGKTTLLSLVSGDNPQAYSNRISLFGRRRGTGETIWEIKGRIGMISSEFQMGYDKPVTVFDAVLSGFFDSVGLYRKTTSEQQHTAEAWINALGLGPLLHERFDRLSFGQRRLALLARAMVKQPTLLILDEPCQGLDMENRLMILNVVERIAKNGRTHILYVTHFHEEVPACVTHVLTLEIGKK